MSRNININNELTLDEARELLKGLVTSDEELAIILEDLKILCEIASHIYKNNKIKNAA